MAVSIEGFFLINFAMDFLAMSVVARGFGRIRWRRICLAALLGAAYATAAQIGPLRPLRSLPCQVALTVLMSLLSLPLRSGRTAAFGAVALFGGTVFLGGVQFFLYRQLTGHPYAAFAAGALIGICALMCFMSAKKRKLVTWEVRVFASTEYGEARFDALVDTGNRLREPLSDLPVMIAEYALIADILPPGVDPQRDSGRLPAGFRAIAFGALGGVGKLMCFMPDTVYVDAGDGYAVAPEIWIAIYPGDMPGTVRALAPPILGCERPAEKLRRAN